MREQLARKHGWHPPIRALDRPLLGKRAITIWRDSRQRVADVKDASAATDAEAIDTDAATRTDAATVWAGESLPARATDWREVAEALGVDPDGNVGLAIMAALSGYGTGAEVATVLGITEPTARKRLQRGREAGAALWQHADNLRDALADAGYADRPLADRPVMADPRIRADGRWPLNGTLVGAERVRLDAERRTLRRLLDRMASTDTAPHAAKLDRDPRQHADPLPLDHGAPRPVDARSLPTPAGPVAVRRVQPERVTVATRREYLPPGPRTVTLPTRTRTPDPADAAQADARWIAATTPTPARTTFRPRTASEQERVDRERENAAALAVCRASRPWDRRRKLCHG